MPEGIERVKGGNKMTEAEEKNAYGYCLNKIAGVGDKTLLQLTQIHKDPREIYERLKAAGDKLPQQYAQVLSQKQIKAVCEAVKGIKDSDIKEEYEKLSQKGIHFMAIFSEEYPGRLKNIPDPPYAIYVKGQVPKEEVLSVAVIGARECSEYGRYVGQEIGKILGKNGVQVISGMARGIDGISQGAALEAGGSSFGVLGCGVDICYPAGNRQLYERLLKHGGILSSFPPGTLPKAQHFPPRNRIVSGLSDVVIVVEARLKSGTLITVDMALEQGREVYVVPGRLTDRLSDGCNKLIKQGAGIILSPEEFLREMEESFPGKTVRKEKRKERKNITGPDLTEDSLERKVYEGIDFYPRSVEQIKEAAGVDIPYYQMQQILMKLCLTSYVKQVSTGFYEKNASATGF